jgi:hypothetical protein
LPPLGHGHGRPLLFLVVFFLDIIMFSCVPNCTPLGCGRGHGHPFTFLVVFFLAIAMVVFLHS